MTTQAVTPSTRPWDLFPYIKAKTTATVNTGAIAANTTNITTVNLNGTNAKADIGDFVVVGAGADMLGCIMYGYVQAQNVIKIAVANVSAGSLTPASQTVQILVLAQESGNFVA